MTLAERLLEKLSDWPPPADGGRHSLTVGSGDGSTATVTAAAVDTVGAVVWDVNVASPPTAEALGDRAARVAGRVRGLMEGLRVHEVDAGRDEAVLRSDTPAVRGDDKYYYEVHLGGTDRATARRYVAKPGARREAVAFPLTHEAIAKLAGDLV